MVIHDFHVKGIFAVPPETDSPLVVDSNAVLPFAIALQGFQVIAIGNTQIVEPPRLIQEQQFAPGRALNLRRQTPGPLIVEQTFGFTAGKAAYHPAVNYNARRYRRSSCELIKHLPTLPLLLEGESIATYGTLSMKFAIIADIHANLEALLAVLEHARQQSCTHYAFVGDIVGYCADPKACVQIVRGMNAPCVKGNHDEYCATNRPLDGFNQKTAKAVEWTRRQLSPDERQWLQQLPYSLQIEDFTIVHATLDAPQRWGYVFDNLAAAQSLVHQSTAVCFFGHTHVPVAFVRDSMVRGGTFKRLRVEHGKKYFVNCGAVGQPRDNNPKAAYVTFSLRDAMIELHRVDYDIATTQRKIREAGLTD